MSSTLHPNVQSLLAQFHLCYYGSAMYMQKTCLRFRAVEIHVTFEVNAATRRRCQTPPNVPTEDDSLIHFLGDHAGVFTRKVPKNSAERQAFRDHFRCG